MDPDKLKAAIEALKNADGDAALKILEDMLTGAASPAAPAEPGADALAEGADPKPEEPAALSAAVSTVLMQLTGATTAAGAVEVFRGLKTRIDSIDSDRAVIELSERRGLIADLVKLGVDTPATAWDGKPEDRKPVKRLADEPIADLRARVTSLKAAKGGTAGHRTPEGRAAESTTLTASAGGKIVTLSDGRQVAITASEIAGCKTKGLTHEEFAARKANAVKRTV